jgi:hypothetical protein
MFADATSSNDACDPQLWADATACDARGVVAWCAQCSCSGAALLATERTLPCEQAA